MFFFFYKKPVITLTPGYSVAKLQILKRRVQCLMKIRNRFLKNPNNLFRRKILEEEKHVTQLTHFDNLQPDSYLCV
jgi:hypothetical protein